ncbi:hypothetical protein ACRU3B_06515 [Mycobacterium colombiense]
MIPKLLVGVAGMAIALGVSGAATASASTDPNPNPYSHLSCACKDSDPAGSPALRDKINRGIHQGISAAPAAG